MTYMLCRNRVADFAKWKRGFDLHTKAHRDAGLKLLHLWCDLDDPNNVFFLFEVGNLKKAKAFISTPEAADAGKEFGVLEGEVNFIVERPDKRPAGVKKRRAD